jgi:hypothetical protein
LWAARCEKRAQTEAAGRSKAIENNFDHRRPVGYSEGSRAENRATTEQDPSRHRAARIGEGAAMLPHGLSTLAPKPQNPPTVLEFPS